jgi:hypothetical protein
MSDKHESIQENTGTTGAEQKQLNIPLLFWYKYEDSCCIPIIARNYESISPRCMKEVFMLNERYEIRSDLKRS